ncbi:hypothetical protein N9241_02065, partial [bacterium]|nr:hypothetical protein [bacterium]
MPRRSRPGEYCIRIDSIYYLQRFPHRAMNIAYTNTVADFMYTQAGTTEKVSLGGVAFRAPGHDHVVGSHSDLVAIVVPAPHPAGFDPNIGRSGVKCYAMFLQFRKHTQSPHQHEPGSKLVL